MLDFETIKSYFDKGLWTAAMVNNAVAKGKITAQQFEALTGQAYSSAK